MTVAVIGIACARATGIRDLDAGPPRCVARAALDPKPWDRQQFFRSFASGASGALPGGPFRSYETAAAIEHAAAVRSELAASADVSGERRNWV
jgi:hypothetical protein